MKYWKIFDFDQNTGYRFKGFRSEVWKSYGKLEEFRSENLKNIIPNFVFMIYTLPSAYIPSEFPSNLDSSFFARKPRKKQRHIDT